MEKKALAVNIALKDNTKINKCWLYLTDEKGQLPIEHEESIHKLLQENCWEGKQKTVIFFQTSMMNGHIPIANIDEYEIVEVPVRG